MPLNIVVAVRTYTILEKPIAWNRLFLYDLMFGHNVFHVVNKVIQLLDQRYDLWVVLIVICIKGCYENMQGLKCDTNIMGRFWRSAMSQIIKRAIKQLKDLNSIRMSWSSLWLLLWLIDKYVCSEDIPHNA